MTLDDMLAIYSLLEGSAIHFWVEGGWGVDALLGQQTREHADLDCIVQQDDVPQMQAILGQTGFRLVDDEHWWHFVMADASGRSIDVRVITLDSQGNGMYGPAELHLPPYPAQSLTATGMLGGKIIQCLSAEQQVASHTGYDRDEQDVHDMHALHERFGVPLPTAYQQ